jgi:hypothetical protein
MYYRGIARAARLSAQVVLALGLVGGMTACTPGTLSIPPVSVVEHFAKNPTAAPASVKPGDKYFVHDGSGTETYKLKLPKYARSVTLFLACDADVNGTIGVRYGSTVVGEVTLEGCGGENWSSGGHDVSPAAWPDSVHVTVKEGVKWKATIYVSADPIPTP